MGSRGARVRCPREAVRSQIRSPPHEHERRHQAENPDGAWHGETRTRTGHTAIFSRVLYQLSYLAEGGLAYREVRGPRIQLMGVRAAAFLAGMSLVALVAGFVFIGGPKPVPRPLGVPQDAPYIDGL